MADGPITDALTRNWIWIVLRGVAAILFGVLCFVTPGITLAALVLVWGAYALFDGLVALMAGFKIRMGGKPTWPLVLVGLVGVAAGITTLLRPQITALVLLSFIAAWALITGVLQIAAAVRFRKVIPNEWTLILAGLLSVAFGVFMLVRPGAGALAVVWIIGWYATLLGVFLVMLGFRIKGFTDHLMPKPAAQAHA